ncbi:MAG: 6-carboxytetrahydropterin synthase QueD [Planctomycetota bacterium]|nr:6-carboxytetrahydropterin synthase QueD [Planctomycetota bacterium]
MEVELVKTFRFEAAHSLPHVPPGHKCARLHGHGYRLDVHVSGTPDARTGWLMDFGDIKKALAPILEDLDHHCLNDIPGLANSTSELLAKYIWDRLRPALPILSAVSVWESDTSRCIYRGQ